MGTASRPEKLVSVGGHDESQVKRSLRRGWWGKSARKAKSKRSVRLRYFDRVLDPLTQPRDLCGSWPL